MAERKKQVVLDWIRYRFIVEDRIYFLSFDIEIKQWQLENEDHASLIHHQDSAAPDHPGAAYVKKIFDFCLMLYMAKYTGALFNSLKK